MPGPGRPWVKGQSGNPNGRPKKGETLTDLLAQYLKGYERLPSGERIQRRQALLTALFRAAISGSVEAQKYLIDRIDGKPRQPLEHAGPEGEPMHFKVDLQELFGRPDGPPLEDNDSDS